MIERISQMIKEKYKQLCLSCHIGGIYTIMKRTSVIYSLMLIISLILISCESLEYEEPEFSVKFSDGTIINEQDIIFYDSSTCNLFLKNKLQIDYVIGETPNVDYIEFSVNVDKDEIYQGIIYPADVAVPSPTPLFIGSYSHPNFDSDIVPFRYVDFYTNSIDKRNNPQIINCLDKSHLLNYGITCRIDSVYISAHNDSSVICVFTINNHDNINYYIPDPNKMGTGRFSFCMGGLYLKSKETNSDIYGDWINLAGWEVLTIGDFSFLECNGEITFTYECSFNSKINEGNYECRFYYKLLHGYGTLAIPLTQNDGRIWAGDIYLNIDNITIKK